jgi:RNase H-fold protein (predicted Holliday junction resolvase)
MSDDVLAHPDLPPSPPPSMILGFDPGRQKCGVAVMGSDRTLHIHQVVAAETVISTLDNLCKIYPIALLVMGDQTTAQEWQQRLQHLAQPLNIIQVDERFSTLEARDRYWQMYPPKGLERLIPRGLRTPPRPLDDIVALILIERYLEQHGPLPLSIQ